MPLYSDMSYLYSGSSGYSPYYTPSPTLTSSYSGYSRGLSSGSSYTVPAAPRTTSFAAINRHYKPMLTTISESSYQSGRRPQTLTSLTRINSPKFTLTTSTYKAPRPIQINTADIDVTSSRYNHNNTRTERSLSKTPERIVYGTSTSPAKELDSPFMPRVDQNDPPNTRSTIKRDRNIVRLSTVRTRSKSSSKNESKSLERKSSTKRSPLAATPTTSPEITYTHSPSPEKQGKSSWRDRFGDDLLAKPKDVVKKTPGELILEKHIIKDKSKNDAFKIPTDDATKMIYLEPISRKSIRRHSLVKCPSFKDICKDISSDLKANDDLNAVDLRRRASLILEEEQLLLEQLKQIRRRSSDDSINVAMNERLEEPPMEEVVHMKRKSHRKSSKLMPALIAVEIDASDMKAIREDEILVIDNKASPKWKAVVEEVEEDHTVHKVFKLPKKKAKAKAINTTATTEEPKIAKPKLAKSPSGEDFWGAIGSRETVYYNERKRQLLAKEMKRREDELAVLALNEAKRIKEAEEERRLKEAEEAKRKKEAEDERRLKEAEEAKRKKEAELKKKEDEKLRIAEEQRQKVLLLDAAMAKINKALQEHSDKAEAAKNNNSNLPPPDSSKVISDNKVDTKIEEKSSKTINNSKVSPKSIQENENNKNTKIDEMKNTLPQIKAVTKLEAKPIPNAILQVKNEIKSIAKSVPENIIAEITNANSLEQNKMLVLKTSSAIETNSSSAKQSEAEVKLNTNKLLENSAAAATNKRNDLLAKQKMSIEKTNANVASKLRISDRQCVVKNAVLDKTKMPLKESEQSEECTVDNKTQTKYATDNIIKNDANNKNVVKISQKDQQESATNTTIQTFIKIENGTGAKSPEATKQKQQTKLQDITKEENNSKATLTTSITNTTSVAVKLANENINKTNKGSALNASGRTASNDDDSDDKKKKVESKNTLSAGEIRPAPEKKTEVTSSPAASPSALSAATTTSAAENAPITSKPSDLLKTTTSIAAKSIENKSKTNTTTKDTNKPIESNSSDVSSSNKIDSNNNNNNNANSLSKFSSVANLNNLSFSSTSTTDKKDKSKEDDDSYCISGEESEISSIVYSESTDYSDSESDSGDEMGLKRRHKKRDKKKNFDPKKMVKLDHKRKCYVLAETPRYPLIATPRPLQKRWHYYSESETEESDTNSDSESGGDDSCFQNECLSPDIVRMSTCSNDSGFEGGTAPASPKKMLGKTRIHSTSVKCNRSPSKDISFLVRKQNCYAHITRHCCLFLSSALSYKLVLFSFCYHSYRLLRIRPFSL